MFSDTPIYIVCFANIQTIIFFAFENINAEHVLIRPLPAGRQGSGTSPFNLYFLRSSSRLYPFLNFFSSSRASCSEEHSVYSNRTRGRFDLTEGVCPLLCSAIRRFISFVLPIYKLLSFSLLRI